MSKRIVVVGSINMDLVATTARMPAAGETVHGEHFATWPGGKGANQAVAAARLGGDVTLIGQVGSDAFADTLMHGLQQAGVNTQHVGRSACASGCALILVDDAGRNSIVVIEGANGTLTIGMVDAAEEACRHAAVMLVQLETPLETVLHVARLASRHRIPLILDPSPARELPAELLGNTSWLTPNETECATLLRRTAVTLSSDTTPEVAHALLALGPRNVVLKMGSQGVFLAGKDIADTFIPAVPVQAVDTTAAGDAFNGAFAYALAGGLPLRHAAEFACSVAAVCVTRRGAQSSMPRLRDLPHQVP